MSTSRTTAELLLNSRSLTSPSKHSATSPSTTSIVPTTTTSSPFTSTSPVVRQSNLPLPPPPDRKPPSKGHHGRPPLPASSSSTSSGGGGEGGRQKFKLLRRDKERTNSSSTTGSGVASEHKEDDEEWMLDESPVTFPPPERPDASDMSDSFPTEVPEVQRKEREQEKKSKGRSLVKKTSRLFSRGNATVTPASNETDIIEAAATRQISVSSDSSNGRGHLASASISRSPPHSRHSRRQSQDSQASWAPSHSVRSGSISINADSESLPYAPRRQGSQLSTSLPPFSRHSMPPPIPSAPNGASRAPETLPSRMSTWFSHLLPSSSTTTVDNPSPSTVDQQPPSPARKGPSAAASFLNAARQKAVGGMRYLLDSEAAPDKCEEKIWVMGVGHPGWTPSSPVPSTEDLPESEGSEAGSRRGSHSSNRGSPAKEVVLRPSTWNSRRKDQTGNTASPPKTLGNLSTSSTLALINSSPIKDEVKNDSPGKKLKKEKEVLKWPEQFYEDFRSTVWCTYRAQYAPIVSLPQNMLLPTPEAYYSAFGPPAKFNPSALGQSALPSSKPSTSPWTWSRSDERGLTSDAGWGCMLRTGQSMLANALVRYHLGRDWRLPHQKPSLEPESAAQLAQLEAYATYVKVLSWFLDDPSPLAPFSVHRMALIGKELGKEVGEWFGPSTAAGALKTLANSFPISGVSVATAADSIIYKSDVYAASNIPNAGWEEGNKRQNKMPVWKTTEWGKKAVLILIGIRLGLEGVNPIYYDSIKALFTFPQSVGIAGGRPSSSYYFVATQANSLFYLDPHYTRPTVPLRTPPAQGTSGEVSQAPTVESSQVSPSSTLNSNRTGDEEAVLIDEQDIPIEAKYMLDVVDVDDVSSDGEVSSPSRRMGRSTTITQLGQITPPSSPSATLFKEPETPSTPTASRTSTVPPASMVPDSKIEIEKESNFKSPTGTVSSRNILPVDPQTAWYASAYPEAQLRSFHCDRVKKMPLSGLDPSMLLGFLCRDEADFEDFCSRVAKLPQKIFTVQDEPLVWDDNEDGGLESVSEPDLDDGVGDGDEPNSIQDDHEEGEATPELLPVKNGVEIDPKPKIDLISDLGAHDTTVAFGSFTSRGGPSSTSMKTQKVSVSPFKASPSKTDESTLPFPSSHPYSQQKSSLLQTQALAEGLHASLEEEDELEAVVIHSPSRKSLGLGELGKSKSSRVDDSEFEGN